MSQPKREGHQDRTGVDRGENLPRDARSGSGLIRVVSSEPVGDGVRSVHVAYEFPEGRWTQTFLSRPLTPAPFEQALREADLTLGRGRSPRPPRDRPRRR
ncbi:hypothetical protein [Streptomyces sp. NPDC088910]|uniref:hypothetical protein n=1 Tax=Streptomyces sp. NPDC088910 TaxID=3365911 RepID=UPI003808E1C2